MYCKNCGAKMPKDKDYCIRCGGKNQAGIASDIPDFDLENLGTGLPMRYHNFYLFILTLGILFSSISMFTQGFKISVIGNVVVSAILLFTLAKQQKIGYLLFMVFNLLEIIGLLLFYGMFILALFGIAIFSKINPFLEIFAFGSVEFSFLALFTAMIAIMVGVLFATRIYYKKRKDMFS